MRLASEDLAARRYAPGPQLCSLRPVQLSLQWRRGVRHCPSVEAWCPAVPAVKAWCPAVPQWRRGVPLSLQWRRGVQLSLQ